MSSSGSGSEEEVVDTNESAFYESSENEDDNFDDLNMMNAISECPLQEDDNSRQANSMISDESSLLQEETSDSIAKSIIETNEKITEAKTPHKTQCLVGPKGNVYQYVVINVPLMMLEDEAKFFKDIKKYEMKHQLYYKALMFVVKAICNSKIGSNSYSSLYFKDGQSCPKFIVKVELLVQQIYKNKNNSSSRKRSKRGNNPTDDDEFRDLFGEDGSDDDVHELDDIYQNKPLEFHEMVKSTNRSGYRLHFMILDPEYSVDKAIMYLLNKNARRMCKRVPFPSKNKENENEEDDDDDSSDDNGDDNSGGGDDDNDDDDDDEDEDDNEGDEEDEDDEEGGRRHKKKSKKSKKHHKSKKFKKNKKAAEATRRENRHYENKRKKSFKEKLNVTDDKSYSAKIDAVKEMYKNIYEVRRFSDMVLYPLTHHSMYANKMADIDETHEFTNLRNKKGDGFNILNSVIWGSFEIANCVLFGSMKTHDEGAGGRERSVFITHVCEEQRDVSNYVRPIEDGEHYEIVFPEDRLVCEYTSENFLALDKMGNRRLPYSISVFDFSYRMLNEKYKRKVNRDAMIEGKKNTLVMSDTYRATNKMKSITSFSRDSSRNTNLSMYEELGESYKMRNTMQLINTDKISEQDCRMMGGEFLVQYKKAEEMRDKVTWVRTCMPGDYIMMNQLMQDEALLRLQKVMAPGAEVSENKKHIYRWFDTMRQNTGSTDFIYSQIQTLDYTKGRISLYFTELIFYDTYYMLSYQHQIMSEIEAGARGSHQHYRFLQWCGFPDAKMNQILFGSGGCGKSVITSNIIDTSINMSIASVDTESDKFRTAAFIHGGAKFSDEMQSAMVGSGKSISMQEQQMLNNTKSILTKHFTGHNVMDQVETADGKKERVAKAIFKDQDLFMVGSTNTLSTRADDAFLNRFKIRYMGKCSTRLGKDPERLAACYLDEDEKRSKDQNFTPWTRSSQYLNCLACDIQSLGGISPGNINAARVYYPCSMRAVGTMDKSAVGDIRAAQQCYAKASEACMRAAYDIVFHSELSEKEIINENFQVSFKEFTPRDLIKMNPFMCLREDTAIKIVLEAVQDNFPKFFHEVMLWLAVYVAGYRPPKDTYITDEYAEWMDRIYGTNVFRDPLVNPMLKLKNSKVIKTAPNAKIDRVPVEINGVQGFYFPSFVVEMGAQNLVNFVHTNKTTGMRFGWPQIYSMFMNLKKRTVTYTYNVYTFAEEACYDPLVDETEGVNKQLKLIGTIDVTQQVIENVGYSATSSKTGVRISLGYVDRFPAYYSMKVLSRIMHCNIRESGTIITEQGKKDMEIKLTNKIKKQANLISDKTEHLRKRISKCSPDNINFNNLSYEKQALVQCKLAPTREVQQKIKSLEAKMSTLENSIRSKERKLDDAKQNIMANIQIVLSDLESTGTDRVEEAKTCIEECQKALRIFESENSGEEDATFWIKKVRDACINIHKFYVGVRDVRNWVLSSSSPANRPLCNTERSPIIQEMITQIMIRDRKAGWFDITNETPDIRSKAIIKNINGTDKIFRTVREFCMGTTHPQFPQFLEMTPVRAGNHKLRIENSKFMDEASYRAVTSHYDIVKRNNIAFSSKRENVFMDYDTDVEKQIFDEHLASIGMQINDPREYYPQNLDDKILIFRESINAYHIKTGNMENYVGRFEYPNDFIESAREKEEMIILENTKSTTVMGDPDQMLINYFLKKNRVADSMRQSSVETTSKMFRKSRKKGNISGTEESTYDGISDSYLSSCESLIGSSDESISVSVDTESVVEHVEEPSSKNKKKKRKSAPVLLKESSKKKYKSAVASIIE